MVDQAVRPRFRGRGFFVIHLFLSFHFMLLGAAAFLPRSLSRFRICKERSLHLPSRGASVTGIVYEAEEKVALKVTLFTKEGCTLCDKVKDVLVELRENYPHSLSQVDITDREHADWFDRYKYDIPVLHLNGKYWIKHRLSVEEAQEGFQAMREGRFQSPRGEPNAKATEH